MGIAPALLVAPKSLDARAGHFRTNPRVYFAQNSMGKATHGRSFAVERVRRSIGTGSRPEHLGNIGMSSASGATLGARRKYLSMSLGFADPARSRRKSSAARKEPTFSATAAAMNWFNDTPSVAANSAAAFFTDVGSFNG